MLRFRYATHNRIKTYERRHHALVFITSYILPWKNPHFSLSVTEGDIIFIHAMGNDFVVAGGIWQVQWRHDFTDDYPIGYVLSEVTCTGLELVEVEQFLQEEEYALFEDAVAHAEAFVEAHGQISGLTFVNGREVGVNAPENIHQMTVLPEDIRAAEHRWYIIISGIREYTPGTIFCLLEVTYGLQDQEWQFAVRPVEEHNNYLSAGSLPLG